MSPASFLRVIGAGFELAGIGTVALGISRTRARFARPSTVQKSLSAVKRFVSRFRRREERVVYGAATSGLSMGGGRAYGTVTQSEYADAVRLEERIERLRLMVNQHAESLTRLDDKLDDERDDRKRAEARAGQAQAEMAERLEGVVENLAVGSLRLETWGVVALSIGVVLSTWGNLLT